MREAFLMLLTNGAKAAADGLPPFNDGIGESAKDRRVEPRRCSGSLATTPGYRTQQSGRAGMSRNGRIFPIDGNGADGWWQAKPQPLQRLSLIHISEPTRPY